MLSKQEKLARYQRDLLDALDQSSSAEQAEQLLTTIAALNEQRVSFSDPRMLDIAMLLTKQWGVKRSD